jgi:transcriptional regulator with XRE-family HTH domain
VTDEGFGQRVLQARLDFAAKRGRTISQVEVGKAVGVTGVSVGRWESGEKEPDLETIGRLARFLEVSPGWLAFGDASRDYEGRVDSVKPVAPTEENGNGISSIEHPPQSAPGLTAGRRRGKHDRHIE